MATDNDKPRIGDEIRKMEAEPLLPIEKKLIAWSLILGVVLLADPGLDRQFLVAHRALSAGITRYRRTRSGTCASRTRR